jgi:ankyrin repeat protein
MSTRDVKELFFQAVHQGNVTEINKYLNMGADVNAYDKWETALYIAADKGNVEVMKLLLDRGANINAISVSCDML